MVKGSGKDLKVPVRTDLTHAEVGKYKKGRSHILYRLSSLRSHFRRFIMRSMDGLRVMIALNLLAIGGIFNVEPMIWLNVQPKNELKRMTQSNKNKYAQYSLDDLINE
jgi:hypothetical protein